MSKLDSLATEDFMQFELKLASYYISVGMEEQARRFRPCRQGLRSAANLRELRDIDCKLLLLENMSLPSSSYIV